MPEILIYQRLLSHAIFQRGDVKVGMIFTPGIIDYKKRRKQG